MTDFCLGWRKQNCDCHSLERGRKRRWLALGLSFVFLIVVGVYLVQINTIAAKGYQLKELENQIASLKKENDRLEVSTVERQAMRFLNEKIQTLSMVPTDNLGFFDVTGVAFAKK